MELAGRGERLKAALLDGALAAVLYLPAALAPLDGGVKAVFLLGFLALVAYQSWLIGKTGQSIGKKQLRIKIVRAGTGEHPGFGRAVALRWWLNGLLCHVPLYFLIDSLMIFREDRRCAHDFLAGTAVVKAEPAVQPVL